MIEDIRNRVDGPNGEPTKELRNILDDSGYRGKRCGIEWDSYGLTARQGMRVSKAMDGFCELIDASDLVSGLRVIKSEAEITSVCRAAKLADDGYDLACELTREGTFDGDILAAMQGAVFRGGGDYPGNEFIIDIYLLCFIYK